MTIGVLKITAIAALMPKFKCSNVRTVEQLNIKNIGEIQTLSPDWLIDYDIRKAHKTDTR